MPDLWTWIDTSRARQGVLLYMMRSDALQEASQTGVGAEGRGKGEGGLRRWRNVGDRG